MTTETAFEHFVTPMRRRFVVPQGLPQDDYLADVAESLEAFSDHQLASAATWFRDHREHRTFPTSAECRRACGRFVETPVSRPVGLGFRYVSDEERRSEAIIARQQWLDAVRMCRCDIGHRADSEGWLTSLVEFCRDRGRLPDAREEIGLERRARQIDDNLHREPRPIMYGALCRLRRSMVEKAHRDVFGHAA